MNHNSVDELKVPSWENISIDLPARKDQSSQFCLDEEHFPSFRELLLHVLTAEKHHQSAGPELPNESSLSQSILNVFEMLVNEGSQLSSSEITTIVNEFYGQSHSLLEVEDELSKLLNDGVLKMIPGHGSDCSYALSANIDIIHDKHPRLGHACILILKTLEKAARPLSVREIINLTQEYFGEKLSLGGIYTQLHRLQRSQLLIEGKSLAKHVRGGRSQSNYLAIPDLSISESRPIIILRTLKLAARPLSASEIIKLARKYFGEHLSRGSLRVWINQLQTKQLLTGVISPPQKVQGGRRKFLYEITKEASDTLD